MPTTSLLQAKVDMLAQRPLPSGYRMDVDGEKGCIIVHGPSLCFAVTGNAIAEGRHKAEFGPSLDGLIAAETNPAAIWPPSYKPRAA